MNRPFPHVPECERRDMSDQLRLRHARERHSGFPIGSYRQPPPMLFSRDGHNLMLGDIYRGHTAFLVAGGPSLASHNLELLQSRGILTLGMNNATTVVRTDLWCSVDNPGNFCDAIWYDPGILKFVPLCHMEKRFLVRDQNDDLVDSKLFVGDMPGVIGYRRNEKFVAEQWLYEDTFNWGNHSREVDAYGQKGSRSVMFVALRLLFYLGIRRVFLVGCDFRMEVGKKNYAFEQDRSPSSIRGNNSSYKIMHVRFSKLLPFFEAEGFQVFNCTPESGLEVFPYVPYEDAIESATSIIPGKIITSGMYDRAANNKQSAQQSEQGDEKRGSDLEANVQNDQAERTSAAKVMSKDVTLVSFVTPDDEQSVVHAVQNWLGLGEKVAATRVLIGCQENSRLLADAEFRELTNGVVEFIPSTVFTHREFLIDILENQKLPDWVVYLAPNVLAVRKPEFLIPPELVEKDSELIAPREVSSTIEFPWMLIGKKKTMRDTLQRRENGKDWTKYLSRIRLESFGWECIQNIRLMKANI